MTDANVKLARLARRVMDRGGRSRASGEDRSRARCLLFSTKAQKAAPQPDRSASLVEVLQFYLMSAAFEHSSVSQAMSRDARGLAEPMTPADLLWAGSRLPLTSTTRERLAAVVTRGDLLAALFSDLTFLRVVMAGRKWDWSVAVFLPHAKASAVTGAFIDRLLKKRSSLLSRATLARLGLDGPVSARDLYRYGELGGFRSNDLFDASFYARKNDTGSSNYFDNLRLYVEGGEAAGHSPNPFLSSGALIAANPDLAGEIQAGRIESYLEHVLARDSTEQRSAAAHFDASFYATQISEPEQRRYSSPLGHYVNEGWQVGLEPNPCFDQTWYLRTYPDARKSVKEGVWPNAFSHFVMEGDAAGYRPNAFFDPAAYGQANRDIAESQTTTPFRHFWQRGRLEARDFGQPETAPIARHFYRRLPDSRDRVEAGMLTRSSGLPRDVLEQAARPNDGENLVSVLQSHKDSASCLRAVRQALRQLGRPRINIEVGRYQQIHAGDSTRLYVSGLATFGCLSLVKVRVVSDDFDTDCSFFRYHRLDEVEAHSILGGDTSDLRAGFMAWFDFSANDLPPGTRYLELEFVFGSDDDAEVVLTHETIHLQVFKRPIVSKSEASVQVAMATYNPPERPFAAQVESILANPGTHLLISDDASPVSGARVLAEFAGHERIELDVNTHNANFVSNFERSLYMRSDSAEFLLFADQDDVWRADKAARLTAMIKPGVGCVFSDMRIVKGDGEVISETFWKGRNLHHADPLTLGVANTVTGAAAAFPIWLADILTPFPRYLGIYHDQWLSVLASAAGRIDYTPSPLYDYVQHGANVLGFSGSRSGTETHWKAVARRLRSAARRGQADRRDLGYVELALASTIPLLQRFVLLNEALVRVPVWRDPKVHALARLVSDAIQGQPFDSKRLLREWRGLARRAGGAAGLLNIDDMFAAILTARSLIDRGVVSSPALKALRDDAYWAGKRQVTRDHDPNMGLFERKTQPLKTAVNPKGNGSLRINMFLPELQLETFFGGYHSKISLISRLASRGVRTRLILVDQPVVDFAGVARIVGAFPELELGLMRAEIEAHGSRSSALELGTNDALLATTWWSAHIVNAIRREISRERFLYFIQEYEPFTFDLGTNYRGAEMTYDFPHDAIFSTEILRDYFAHAKVGVFGLQALTNAEALAFRNPITGLKGVERRPLSRRRPRLLFYARPQAHASRNMYEFGVAALRQAVRELGPELDGWELVGVGASANAVVILGGDRELRLVAKLDSAGYRDMLAGSDVGLALMYTPHPSLVPLEMAAAGLVTVTNACMTKTRAAFAGISDLIDVAEPEVHTIARSLIAAVRRVNAGPVPHHPIDWPVSPEQAFPDAWLDVFVERAERSLRAK